MDFSLMDKRETGGWSFPRWITGREEDGLCLDG